MTWSSVPVRLKEPPVGFAREHSVILHVGHVRGRHALQLRCSTSTIINYVDAVSRYQRKEKLNIIVDVIIQMGCREYFLFHCQRFPSEIKLIPHWGGQ